MDAASPKCENGQVEDTLSHKRSPKNDDLGSEHVQGGPIEQSGIDSVDNEHLETSAGNTRDVESNFGRGDSQSAAEKSSIRSRHKGKKVSSKPEGRKYILRSSSNGESVLQSRSMGANEIPPDSSTNLVHPSTERRKNQKKPKKTKKTSKDEFSRIKKRFRYFLSRMNYERSLIDAYSGEGWKGQSVEKIRPEMELQRAKSEILRCKVGMRDLFQRLDSLCSEGRPQESSFDPEGQIDSENIFCAKCGSKDYSACNDIILCDGICNRGFHQMCLEPPLLNEEIPPGDEGWLCPGCDCKVDCVELLNDFQGANLSIEDDWEKVFPEAAAIPAGDKQADDLGLPSDDSEDNDYDPDGPEVDEKVQKEGSTSEESDYSSASDDASTSSRGEQYENFGLPSSDSEDGDYDPNGPDPNEKVQKDGSSSDESEFTCDSDGSSDPSNDGESSLPEEVRVSSSPNQSELVTSSEKGRSTMAGKKAAVNSALPSMLAGDLGPENVLPVSGKRLRERLDYKKLHDETYGSIPSDSSGDEDWTGTDSPNNSENDEGIAMSSKGNTQTIENGKNLKTLQSQPRRKARVPKPSFDQSQESLEETDSNPRRRTRQKLESEDVSRSHKDNKDADFIGSKSTTSDHGNFGQAVTQRLREAFRVSDYPSRDDKENLAKELGITIRQVSVWFENARRRSRHLANALASKAEISTASNDTTPTQN